jgi:hypothetical protein
VTVFSEGIDTIFADHNFGEDAIWKVDGVGAGVPVRVIHDSPDQMMNYGNSRAVAQGDVIEVRKSEIATPKEGDIVSILDDEGEIVDTFDIMGTPVADDLRLVWTCEAKRRPSP